MRLISAVIFASISVSMAWAAAGLGEGVDRAGRGATQATRLRTRRPILIEAPLCQLGRLSWYTA
jgi:hypothetical protein